MSEPIETILAGIGINKPLSELLDTEYPEWLSGTAEQRAHGLADEIFGAQLVEVIKEMQGKKRKKLDLADIEVATRIVHNAMLNAAEQSVQLQDVAERASALSFIRMNTLGSFMLDECETLDEWLRMKMMTTDNQGVLSNLQFLVEYGIQDMMVAGINPDEILEMPGFYGRLKHAVSYWRKERKVVANAGAEEDDEIKKVEKSLSKSRRALDRLDSMNVSHDDPKYVAIQEDINADLQVKEHYEKEKRTKIEEAGRHYAEQVVHILDVVADRSVPTNGVNSIASVLHKRETSMTGSKFFLRNGSTVFVTTGNDDQAAVFEDVTSFVNWGVSDYVTVFEKMDVAVSDYPMFVCTDCDCQFPWHHAKKKSKIIPVCPECESESIFVMNDDIPF